MRVISVPKNKIKYNDSQCLLSERCLVILVSLGCCVREDTIDWAAYTLEIYFSQFWNLGSLRAGC